MNAGTTWIHDYFAARDDVPVSTGGVKETFFFHQYWKRGLGWYAKLFEGCGDNRRFEVASTCFHDVNVPAQIHEALGEIPVLVTLLGPVKPAWSYYLHLRRYGQTRAPLREAVEQFPEILEASDCAASLERWHTAFPAECTHFIWQDQLIASPEGYARVVCDGLGLDYRPIPDALLQRSDAGAVPACYTVARAGSWVTNRLRDLGLFSVVRVANNWA